MRQTVAFDTDGTLIHHAGPKADTPIYETIALYNAFERLGWDMVVWSGGGIDYAERWRNKLGLIHARVVAKGSFKPDIAVDDEEVTLGVVNIRVRS